MTEYPDHVKKFWREVAYFVKWIQQESTMSPIERAILNKLIIKHAMPQEHKDYFKSRPYEDALRTFDGKLD